MSVNLNTDGSLKLRLEQELLCMGESADYSLCMGGD